MSEHAPPRHQTTPDWVKHAVFYQIFPERFANGNTSNDPENKKPWGTTPTPYNYMGGDLDGIINHLDYLSELGITAIYLNPIFHAFSNHKYNTYNYFEIDPHFGDMATFQECITQAHLRGIRVVLDGVFNHCGRGFFAFQSVLEQGKSSPYLNWFHIKKFPLNAYDSDDSGPPNYAAWWNIRSLPKLNTDHPPVRRYLLNVARYWIEQGADGWRLDVPNEIDDHDFWREFRQVVKEANPDAYIVGEIWEDASPWLDGSQFDGVMNYLFRDLCLDFFARDKIDIDAFTTGIEDLLKKYPREATLAQLNLLGSHDTPRFLTELGGDANKFYPVILLQMTYPGAPCIYYGDEVGMEGGKEPGSRGCFPWHEEDEWNTDLRTWIRRCIALRYTYTALRTGSFRILLSDAVTHSFAFARWNEQERLIIVINTGNRAATLNVSLAGMPIHRGASLKDVLNDTRYTAGDTRIEQVQVPAHGGAVLLVE